MKAPMARAIMALASCCWGDRRRTWAWAMQIEFEEAVEDGHALSFAIGCFATACREMVTQEEGFFTLTSYMVALGISIPMAALQIGCALFGLPYLYPGQAGLSGAVLDGHVQEGLLRGAYQAAVPPLTLILLLLGTGHLFIAWAMLERNWDRVRRLAWLALAATVTLIGFMAVLFLDSSHALMQASVVGVELATMMVVARWHAQLVPAAGCQEHPG